MACQACMEAGEMGEPMLWFEETVFVDGDTADAVREWILPLEKYLKVGPNALSLITVQYAAVGPGAAGVSLQFQRSALPTDDDAAFTAITAATPLTRTSTYAEVVYDATTRFVHGLVRFRLIAAAAGADDWSSIRLRIWVTLQPA